MATYPSVPGLGEAVPLNEIEITETDGDQVRGQDLQAQALYECTITHELLTIAETKQLTDFFDANRNTSITTQVFNDGESYEGKLLLEPEIERINSAYNRVTQRLQATRV